MNGGFRERNVSLSLGPGCTYPPWGGGGMAKVLNSTKASLSLQIWRRRERPWPAIKITIP